MAGLAKPAGAWAAGRSGEGLGYIYINDVTIYNRVGYSNVIVCWSIWIINSNGTFPSIIIKGTPVYVQGIS